MIQPRYRKIKQVPLFAHEGLSKELPLRCYQYKSVSETFELFDVYQRILIQQPTGAGKSLIMMAIVREFLLRDELIIIVAHKVELIQQLVGHCQKWLPGVEVGVIANKSRFKRNPNAQIQILSIQAYRFLGLDDRPDAGLIVIDEAHHAHSPSYAKLIKDYPSAYVVGASATPLRIDGRGLRFLHDGVPGFECLVEGVSVAWLIEQGYLSPFKFFAATELFDPKLAGVRTRGGDYAANELSEAANEVLIYGDIVETWKKHAYGRLTVVYPVSVEYSKNLCSEFNAQKIKAAHIDASTSPKERDRILQDFRDRKIMVLCQHSIVIEGVDIPAIDCVVFARPTRSLTIWFQAIGRALRPAPGKEYALIIDHTTTHRELPFPDDPIEWSLDPVSLPEGTKHALTCPECNHVFRSNQLEIARQWSTCPDCQTKFSFEVRRGGGGGVDPRTVKVLPADFTGIEIEKPSDEFVALIDGLFAVVEERGYHKGWTFHEIKRQVIDGEIEPVTLGDLKYLAHRLEYRTGWAFYKLQEIQAAFAEAA